MATCKECLHIEVCDGYYPTDVDRDVYHYCREGRADEIPDIEERCSSFKDRSQFVEVVRCNGCKYKRHNKTYDVILCDHENGLRGLLKPTDFCSSGERREVE